MLFERAKKHAANHIMLHMNVNASQHKRRARNYQQINVLFTSDQQHATQQRKQYLKTHIIQTFGVLLTCKKNATIDLTWFEQK